MNKRQVLIWGAGLIALVGLLAAGLRTVEFRAGHLFLQGSPQWGQPAALQLPYGWLDRLFNLLPWLFLGILVLGVTLALVSREFRRALLSEFGLRLAAGLVLLALLGLAIWLGQLHLLREESIETGKIEPPKLWQPELSAPGPTAPIAETEGSPAALPWWAGYIAAMALAVPLLWLAMRAVRRFSWPLIKGEPKEELAAAARAAAAELRGGLPLEEVVIRCWVQMTECFAGRTGGAGGAPAITPRELARLLAEQGVRHEAIVELTRLFEEVRYGGKADLTRRARALAALEAIEEAYGTA